MKKIFLPLLLVVLSFFHQIPAFAQQSDNEVKLTLENPETKTSQTYSLKNVSYSCSTPSDSSNHKYYDNYVVSMDFKQNMDAFLLKWISGQMKQAKGTISVENKESGKKIRTIVFEHAIAGASSESFASGEGYNYVAAQITLYTKQLIIDHIAMDNTLSSK